MLDWVILHVHRHIMVAEWAILWPFHNNLNKDCGIKEIKHALKKATKIARSKSHIPLKVISTTYKYQQTD